MSSWRKSAPVCKRNGNALSPSERLGGKSNVAIGGICLSGFMNNSNPGLSLRLCINFSRLERTPSKSANIEILFHDEDDMLLRHPVAPIGQSSHAIISFPS